MSRARKLGEAVRRSGLRGRGRRLPEELRRQVQSEAKRLRHRGESIASIARVLCVSKQSIRRWCGARRPGALKLVPVVVQDEPMLMRKVDVVSPTGWRLEGLDLDTAVRVMRSLS